MNPLSFSNTQEIMERRTSQKLVEEYSKIIRLDQLVEAYDEELLTDFVTAIVAESPNHVIQAQNAFAEQDLETLRRVAHTLRGTMRTLGMEDTYELAAELEEKAKHNQLAGGENLLDQLESNVSDISKILQDFLAKCATQTE